MAADTIARFGASLTDAEGVKANATSHLFMDSTQTVASVITAAQAWAAALDGVTGAQITGLHASVVSPLILLPTSGGVKTAPVSGSEVEETGVFDFSQSGLPYRYGQAVPGLLETLITAGQIDEANAAVVAWKNLLIGAVLGGNYTGLSTAALVALVRSFRSDRKRRRQLFARSVRTP